METLTKTTVNNHHRKNAYLQELRGLYNKVRVNPMKKNWRKLLLELESLPEPDASLPMPIKLIARVCNDSLGSRQVLEHPSLLDLFKRLLATFVLSDSFSVIRERCRLPQQEDGIENVLKNLQAVFGIWIFRHYPHLGILLLHPNFSEKYTGLADIPFSQFIRYSPAFVLYRLASMSENTACMIWIRWMAKGKNLRKAPFLPRPLSKQEAHCMYHAPAALPFHGAFFYGLVKAAGGNDPLFRRLYNFFGSVPDDRLFLKQLVSFLSRYQATSSLNNREFNMLMTYIQHHRQEGLSFSLKRRSLNALMRQAIAWEEERQRQAHIDRLKHHPINWDGLPIDEFEQESGKGKWVIHQLNSHLDLVEEGLAMHHCVAGYAYACAQGESSIWSLRRYDTAGEFQRMVTIEVTDRREIVQACGPYNARPKDHEMQMIRRWAEVAELELLL